MKKRTLCFCAAGLLTFVVSSCKKSSNPSSNSSSPIAGFWTYKEDAAQDYWNSNVLFKNDGTFRMYTSLSLSDTVAAQGIADTANQVVTFGTYTVSGKNVKMIFTEFTSVGLQFTGSLNTGDNILIGNIGNNDPSNASPLWYLTKP